MSIRKAFAMVKLVRRPKRTRFSIPAKTKMKKPLESTTEVISRARPVVRRVSVGHLALDLAVQVAQLLQEPEVEDLARGERDRHGRVLKGEVVRVEGVGVDRHRVPRVEEGAPADLLQQDPTRASLN